MPPPARRPAAPADIDIVTDQSWQDLVLASPVTTVVIFWEEKNNQSNVYAEKVEAFVAVSPRPGCLCACSRKPAQSSPVMCASTYVSVCDQVI